MSYERVTRHDLPCDVGGSTELLDLSAASTVTWIPKVKCKVYGWGVTYLEAITANGFSTTAPVLSMEYDKAGSTASVEKSTIAPSTTAGAAVFTEGVDYVNPFLADGPSGDAIIFKVKTAGTGATTLGEARPWVLVEWFPACTGE